MKFRTFFKSKDSIKLSLNEERHYMKHSVIPGDEFPVPVPVMNVLNMLPPHLHGEVFAWIMGEGLRQAAVARRNFSEAVSKWLSEKYGREIKIPQEAIFAKKAIKQFPELAENMDKIQTMWTRLHEPTYINFPYRARSANITSIPLAEINAILVRQGKTPLRFGGQEGLMEYIEEGAWRDEPIGGPEITPYGKGGISLALDPGYDGYKITKEGEHVISLGEDPSNEGSSSLNAISFQGLKDRFNLYVDDETGQLKSYDKQTKVGITQDGKIFIQKPGEEQELFNVKADGGSWESAKFYVPKKSFHPGSYIAPQYGNNQTYWTKKLELCRKESLRTIQSLLDDFQSGKGIKDFDNEQLDYLAQLIQDGQISRDSIQSRSSTMKDLAKIFSKTGGMFQKASGTGEDGGPTDEEWIKYKAAVKAGIIQTLRTPAEKPTDGSRWGDNPAVQKSRHKFSVSGGRGVVDLNAPEWQGKSTDQHAEEIADALMPMIFDDETKSIATRIRVNSNADKKTETFFNQKTWNWPSEKPINVEYNGQMVPVSPDETFQSMRSMVSNVFKMPGIRIQHLVPISQHPIDLEKYQKDGWTPSSMFIEKTDPKDPKKTIRVPIKAETIDEIPDSVTHATLKKKGTMLSKRIIRTGPNAPWQEVKAEKKLGVSEKEIKDYLSQGYQDAWVDNQKSVLQLYNPSTGDELLFRASVEADEKNPNGALRFFNIPAPSNNVELENPYLTGLSLSVNPSKYKIRKRIAGTTNQVTDAWERYMNNPEEYGTSNWRNVLGTDFPPEVISAASKVYEKLRTRGVDRVLADYGNAALEQLQNQVHDLSFRYGELKNLAKRLMDNGITDNVEELENFVKEQLFNQQKWAKEMKSPESLQQSIQSSDGKILAGLDQNGNALFAPEVYKALLESGKLWRAGQALTGMNVAYRNGEEKFNKEKSQGKSSDDDSSYDILGNAESGDFSGWDDEEGDDKIDTSMFGDDELEDEIGVKDRDFDVARDKEIYGDGDDDEFSDAGGEVDPDWIAAQRQGKDLGAARPLKSKSAGNSIDLQNLSGTGLGQNQAQLGSMSGLKSFEPEQPKTKNNQPQTQSKTEPSKFDNYFDSPPQPQPPVKPSKSLKDFVKNRKTTQPQQAPKKYGDNYFDHFINFNQWKILTETGPYDPKVARNKNRTFNVWGSPPEGAVPQKSIDGEIKGIKNGRK